jgi:hypothetical protein
MARKALTGSQEMMKAMLLNEARKVFKELGLKPIKIRFKNESIAYCQYNSIDESKRYLNFNLIYLSNSMKLENLYNYLKNKGRFKGNCIYDFIRFIVYHEATHYLQYSKHFNFSFKMHLKEEKIKHDDRRLEKHADKIANYLINKLS